MAYAWQSIEEAALTLGVSTRTLHRRISRNEVETRLAEGRREVLVCLPDPEPVQASQVEPETSRFDPPAPDPEPAPTSEPQMALALARQEVALANEKVRRTELALMAIQHTTQILQQEAARSRFSARAAWTVVLMLAIGVYIAVGWTASRISQANTQRQNYADLLTETRRTAEQREAQVEAYRAQIERAQLAAARFEGELAATRHQLSVPPATQPATQPSGLWHRLTRLAGIPLE